MKTRAIFFFICLAALAPCAARTDETPIRFGAARTNDTFYAAASVDRIMSDHATNATVHIAAATNSLDTALRHEIAAKADAVKRALGPGTNDTWVCSWNGFEIPYLERVEYGGTFGVDHADLWRGTNTDERVLTDNYLMPLVPITLTHTIIIYTYTNAFHRLDYTAKSGDGRHAFYPWTIDGEPDGVYLDVEDIDEQDGEIVRFGYGASYPDVDFDVHLSLVRKFATASGSEVGVVYADALDSATNALDTAVQVGLAAATNALAQTIPTVPTNVSAFTNDAGYLTEHQALTNYYTRAEADTAIAISTPGNYEIVSNKAMTALQSFTETDPNVTLSPLSNGDSLLTVRGVSVTVPAWALAANKPDYTAEEVGAVPITGGVVTGDVLVSGETTTNLVAAGWETYVMATQILNVANLPNGISDGGPYESDRAVAALVEDDGTPLLVLERSNVAGKKRPGRDGSYTNLVGRTTDVVVVGPEGIMALHAGTNGIRDVNLRWPEPPEGTNFVCGTIAFREDLAALAEDLENFTVTETDPTVSAWAKASTKPTYSWGEIGSRPTQLSDFQNNTGYVTKTVTNGLVKASALATVATSGNYNDLNNKPTIPTVPTNVSAFNNDAGYVTRAVTNGLASASQIPSVPANVSAFNNDAGYLTSYTETDAAALAAVVAATNALPTTPNIFRGTCATAAATQAKVVVCPEFNASHKVAGTILYVTFDKAQTYNGAPTLNVNGTGAVNIKRVGTTNAARYEWVAGETLCFMYDGTYWSLIDGGIATTTYYGATKLAESATSTSTSLALVPSALYKTINNMIEPYAVYSATASYNVGERVRYSFQAWECNTAIGEGGEAWNADHWTPLAPLQTQVDNIVEWAVGDDVSVRVAHAGETNATLTVTYTNALMYSSVIDASNTLARATGYADARMIAALDIVDEAKADKAWGQYTSGGAPAPDDTIVLAKPKVALTGGGDWSYLDAGLGGYWVASVSLGETWNMASLAAAQSPTNPAVVAFCDAEGNEAFTVSSTASREVYAVTGEMLAPRVVTSGANDVITLPYAIDYTQAPVLEFAPTLTNEFATAENWPQYIASVTASGSNPNWTNTVTMVGHPRTGFFRAKYEKAGTVYTSFAKPIGINQIVIGGVTYAPDAITQYASITNRLAALEALVTGLESALHTINNGSNQ